MAGVDCVTDPRIEAAAWMMGSVSDLAPGGDWERLTPYQKTHFRRLAKAVLDAADAAAWRPIAEYSPSMGQVYCGHSEKKWLRHGRMIPGHGTRWYYSGTNERSQWAQQEGDEPTHFRPLPALPASIAELGGVDG